MKNKIPKVVVIGGGTGVFNILTSLKNYPIDLSAIVTIADDGGSSGALREDFGILPPGDIRRALVALAPETSTKIIDLFNYRFNIGNGLKGHSFGNLFLTALERINGNFNQAIKDAGEILNIKGRVIPVSLKECKLVAKLDDGSFVFGETNIDIPKKYKKTFVIKKLFLNHSVDANPDALKAIRAADYIVVGPGDLYTSIVPNFLVSKIKNCFAKSKAKKIYICNIMTKFSETNGFRAVDFLNILEKYICKNCFDFCVINDYRRIPKKLLSKYKREKKSVPVFSNNDFKNYKKLKIIFKEIAKTNNLLRHDPEKIGDILYNEIISPLGLDK
jgi:uncharacterized cofD-like protein